MNTNSHELTAEETGMLIQLLKKLEPGLLPFEIFVQVARLAVLPVVEFVPLRRNKESLEVLLLPRNQDDIFWPGMWHIPGAVVRPDDSSFEDAMKRITADELKDTRLGRPIFAEMALRKSVRGSEAVQLFAVEVLGEPATGKFFDINKLPDKLVEGHANFIKRGVEYFKQENS